MHLIETVLLLLLAVVVSGSIARITRIALPLVQIGLGAVIVLATGKTVDLEPDIFFLLFLPPLLFLDGWRIPKEDLFRDRAVILELALGLVIFTVVGLGFMIWWMIPEMPLAVAFALAAILSPTDPIAVQAIAARAPIPKRLMHILEGESLLNDATGLTCMRIAVIAATTGVFSLTHAIGNFAWLALAGVASGVLVTLAISTAKGWISKRWGEDVGAQILISLLIPFGAYLAAEHVHVSGILAAVSAGITMSYTENSGRALAATRIRRTAVWDTIQFALNGGMFVLAGEQMPTMLRSGAAALREAEIGGLNTILMGIVVITLAMILLRAAWVWISFSVFMFRWGQARPARFVQLVLASSFAGVRGTITLAGVMTFPLMAGGAPFPGRDLAVALAGGVVILSLVLAGLFLPPLLRGLKMPEKGTQERDERRERGLKAE